MYTLILTIVVSSSQAGAVVTTVAGFTSSQACLNAGNAWLQQTREVEYRYGAFKTICVKVKE
jgi:hypothetical protein